MNFEEIGKRIRKRRKELKLTQEALAEKIDVTSTYIGAIERSTSKCSIETLAKLSTILDLDMDYLLFGITKSNADFVFTKLLNSMPKDKQNLFIKLCSAIAEELK
jgi:transcriptional regulator with XRE-family HTH domain